MSTDQPENPIAEWIVNITLDRIDQSGGRTDEEIKALVREVLEEEAIVGYGGDVGLRVYEDTTDETPADGPDSPADD